jgi:hypothetical protein
LILCYNLAAKGVLFNNVFVTKIKLINERRVLMNKEITVLQGEIFYVDLTSMVGSTNYGWGVGLLPKELVLLGMENIPTGRRVATVTQRFYFAVVSAENTNVEVGFCLVDLSDVSKKADEANVSVRIVTSDSSEFLSLNGDNACGTQGFTVTKDDDGTYGAQEVGVANVKYGYPCGVQEANLKYGYPCGVQEANLKYGYPCGVQEANLKYGYPCGVQEANLKYGYPCGVQEANLKYGYPCGVQEANFKYGYPCGVQEANLKYGYPCGVQEANFKYGYPCGVQEANLKYGYPCGVQEANLKYGYPCGVQEANFKYGYPCGVQEANLKYGYPCGM